MLPAINIVIEDTHMHVPIIIHDVSREALLKSSGFARDKAIGSTSPLPLSMRVPEECRKDDIKAFQHENAPLYATAYSGAYFATPGARARSHPFFIF